MVALTPLVSWSIFSAFVAAFFTVMVVIAMREDR